MRVEATEGAANGPRSRYHTGRVADGWIPIIENLKTYRKHIKEVERGAKDAGRSIDDVDCILFVYTALSDDPDAAYEALKPVRTAMISLGYKKLKEAGYDVTLPEGVSEDFYFDQLLIYHETEALLAVLGELATREMVEDFCITGSKDEVMDRIETFASAGVDHFIVINVGPDREETNRVFAEEIMPYCQDSE